MASRRSAGDDSSSLDENDRQSFPNPSNENPSRERSRDENDHPAASDAKETRREENPFSFKHFLRKETRPNYSLSGARPKVYASRLSPEEKPLDSEGIYPCNPTELPDFVQDHLVIEQCYLSPENASASVPLVSELDNLPDFTMNDRRQRRSDAEPSEFDWDLPFDLTERIGRRNRYGDMDRKLSREREIKQHEHLNRDMEIMVQPKRERNGRISNPNRGENFYQRPNQLPVRHAQSSRNLGGFPFDLPASVPNSGLPEAVVNNSPATDGVHKSLPDFLNDGPIRNRVENDDEASSDRLDAAQLALENERLREELKIVRGQLAEQTRMVKTLNGELTSRRAAEHEETVNLEKAMEQVEVNLKRSTKRASCAENTVTLLKQEVKALTGEVTSLREENRELRSIAGASCPNYQLPSTEGRIKKFSEELRSAATTAETSLRQLMAGVANLKSMASALENIDRIEDRTKDYVPDFDEDNAAGSAL